MRILLPLSRSFGPNKKHGLCFQASDVATVCGLNPYRHPFEVVVKYWKKVDEKQHEESSRWATEMGDSSQWEWAREIMKAHGIGK